MPKYSFFLTFVLRIFHYDEDVEPSIGEHEAAHNFPEQTEREQDGPWAIINK
jgi:hypothetical protein